MDCPSCAAGIARSVRGLDGVLDADVQFASATLTVRFDPARVGRERIVARVRAGGYDLAEPPDAVSADRPDSQHGLLDRLRRQRRLLAILLAGLLLAAAAGVDWFGPPSGRMHVVLYLAATAVGGFYVARAALLSLRARRLDMNVLMTIAVVGALAIGYWSEAATVTFLFALSLWLEQRTMDRARHAIRSLLKLKPDRIRLLEPGGVERMVPPERVRVGQRFQVRPSERIGLDGVVVAGGGGVDQSAVTGESMPVAREPGDEVLAGSINLEATLTVEAARPAGQSTISRIIHLVEQAQATRAPAQRFVDRFARVYTPLVVAAAVLVAAGPPLLAGQPFLEPPDAGLGQHGWLYRALVLLVIACPCALVISTPVSVVSALASAARRGVLIKGGVHLETLGRVHCVVFDKTGTLTVGRAEVTDILPAPDFRPGSAPPPIFRPGFAAGEAGGIAADKPRHAPAPNRPDRRPHQTAPPQPPGDPTPESPLDPPDLLRIAAALECHSEHHLARAILHGARDERLDWPDPAEIRILPGRGVAGRLIAGQGPEFWLGNQRLARERGADLDAVAGEIERIEGEGKTLVLVGRGGENGDGAEPARLLGLIAVADQVRPEARAALERLRHASRGLHGRGGARVAVDPPEGDDAATPGGEAATKMECGTPRPAPSSIPHSESLHPSSSIQHSPRTGAEDGPARGHPSSSIQLPASPHRAHLVMLTGDNRRTAAAIAAALSIDRFAAELLPAEKVAQVRRLARDCTGAVAMVGDGINDAPALAAADVGIAMGAAGTDAALQTADVALIGDDLGGVPFAVRLGRRTRRTITQNVWFSLLTKGAFFALGVTGLATLWMAVFADMGASLLVTLNGLRLLRVRRD